MLRVWGKKSVANVQKVLWCLGELGIPFDHEEEGVTVPAAADRAYLAAKSPPAVPVIDDDGFYLWEGNAIARYLAQKHDPGGIWPDDPHMRADADRWMDYQLSTVRVHLHPLMRDTPNADEIAFHSRMMAETMNALEVVLADRSYLAGNRFTIGDIPLGIVTFRWNVLDIARPATPSIDAWYARLLDRPAFRDWIVPPEDAFTPLRA